MMLGDKAVSSIYRYLIVNIKDIGIGKGRVFKYERPEKYSGEYISINHLPFVHKDVVQSGIVNVNVHVPKTASNEPNTKRLCEICDRIAILFDKDVYINGAYFSFYCDSRPTLDNDDAYYINIKLNVIYNNLKD